MVGHSFWFVFVDGMLFVLMTGGVQSADPFHTAYKNLGCWNVVIGRKQVLNVSGIRDRLAGASI